MFTTAGSTDGETNAASLEHIVHLCSVLSNVDQPAYLIGLQRKFLHYDLIEYIELPHIVFLYTIRKSDLCFNVTTAIYLGFPHIITYLTLLLLIFSFLT